MTVYFCPAYLYEDYGLCIRQNKYVTRGSTAGMRRRALLGLQNTDYSRAGFGPNSGVRKASQPERYSRSDTR